MSEYSPPPRKLRFLYPDYRLVVAVSHLQALQALEAAIRLGSLKRAAEALVITPAVVGQRVKTLENYLGIDLLVRGRSGLRATPELASGLGPLSTAFKELSHVADLLNLQRRDEIRLPPASSSEPHRIAAFGFRELPSGSRRFCPMPG
jgi:DNA-binding transcriptional LysR family regulator